MNTDDPKLTAYALGELDEKERSAIARAIADSPDAQRFVAETEKLACALRSQYGVELARESSPPQKFITVYDDPFWSKAGPLAIAAGVALLALIGAAVFSTDKLSGPLTGSHSSALREASNRSASEQFVPVEGEEGAQTGQNPIGEADAGPYAYTGERPFVSARSKPRSSFPIFMASTSYVNVRRSINSGVLPPKDAVRIEQMINYFSYDYPRPTKNEAFSLNVDVVTCPWEPSHRLVRIGLKGGQANVITDDSSVEVEFNPRRIASYRLIGYDRQKGGTPNMNETKAGSEKPAAGYTVTALFEAVPVGQALSVYAKTQPEAPEQLLVARFRVAAPEDSKIQVIERAVSDEEVAFVNAAPDLKFAAAVAEFGMILRDSEYRGNGTLGTVLMWAQEGKGSDTNGDRAEFIDLVQKTQMLKRG